MPFLEVAGREWDAAGQILRVVRSCALMMYNDDALHRAVQLSSTMHAAAPLSVRLTSNTREIPRRVALRR